jgi:hypothetical protein
MGCTETTPKCLERAGSFLGGENLAFVEADALWRELMRANELASARMVLQRKRIKPDCITDGAPADQRLRGARPER